MNNYDDMNYFMPNIPYDFSYLNQMQNTENLINENFWGQSNGMSNGSIGQNSMNIQNIGKINPINNLNFNKCNYNSKTTPSNLYDTYQGFIKGNMFPDLYNQYLINEPYKVEPLNEQAELLTKIDAYGFAAHDLNLYLDTHPEDRNMIDLYNKYASETSRLVDQYENKYGPMFVSSTQRVPWSWNEDPWPWENN